MRQELTCSHGDRQQNYFSTALLAMTILVATPAECKHDEIKRQSRDNNAM